MSNTDVKNCKDKGGNYFVLMIKENYPPELLESLLKVKFDQIWCQLLVLLEQFKKLLVKNSKYFDICATSNINRIESYWIHRSTNTVSPLGRYIIERDWNAFIEINKGILKGKSFMIIVEKCKESTNNAQNLTFEFKIIKRQNIIKIIVEVDSKCFKNKKIKEFGGDIIVKEVNCYRVKNLEPEFITQLKDFVQKKIKDLPNINLDTLLQLCQS